jgi:glycosyltransferase involved in cell wall biosynthesis
MTFWKGWEFSPLAYKARDHVPNCWEFPQAGSRLVVGCHLPIASFNFDFECLNRIIFQNPDIYFVFIDIPGRSDPALGHEIADRRENVIYLGDKQFGTAYQTYACLDFFWIPPFIEISDHVYRNCLALTYAVGKFLLVPNNQITITAPYQLVYNRIADDFGFINEVKDGRPDINLVDRYLSGWTIKGQLEKVISYANTITQEWPIPRPDFGIRAEKDQPPVPWTSIPDLKPIKVGIGIDYFDKGGLESVVALLARNLSIMGCDPFVIVTKKAGTKAQSLIREGIRVYIANDDPKVMRDIITFEKPDVVNTHFTQLKFLKVVSEFKIPIVETIHNTYVWFYEKDWENEKERSGFFSNAIAVSSLVKQYYCHWNNQYPEEKINVIPNAVDLASLSFPSRENARNALSLTDKDILFVNLASYDGRKNQIGLITAFNKVASENAHVQLICAGNILDPYYHTRVSNHLQTLPTKDRISADAFVLPSFFEGWSISGTEALLAGTPVIHTECGSGRELIGPENERGILIPNPGGNPLGIDRPMLDKLVGKIEQSNTRNLEMALYDIIENIEEWREARTQIQPYAQKEFFIDKMLVKYFDVFLNAIGTLTHRNKNS